jgi:hypothetical protein
MSGRTTQDLDARIDRALEALAADRAPAVDLHARVMAALDTHASAQRGVRRFGWGTPASNGGLLARRAFAMATLVVLAVIVLMVWSNKPRERTPATEAETAIAGPRTNDAHATSSGPLAPSAGALSAGAGSAMTSRPAATTIARRRRTPAPQPRGAGLPPLEAPEPIELEPIASAPVQLAALHVERLSIDAIEVDPLDHSGKE